MIIQFSIKNYRLFKDSTTLSATASNYDRDTRENENVIFNEKYQQRLLKSCVIYGANASGKSRFLEALMFMKNFVLSSSKETQKGELINVEPFKLSTETEDQGSEFELIFILNNDIYRYGFEADNKKIIAEWLFHRPKTKEVEIFYRDYQDIKVHARKFSKANTLIKENLVRDNALLLSVSAQFNEPLAVSILNWFKSLQTISGLKEDGYFTNTMEMAKDPIQKDRILNFLKSADIGIDDFKLKKNILTEVDLSRFKNKNVPKGLREAILGLNTYINQNVKNEEREYLSDVTTSHNKYDTNKKRIDTVEFSLKDDESSGTLKFFALIGQIIKTIDNGNVLIVDELDSKLHPNLVCKLISIFNSTDVNPNNAQLIFNTHDTNLLSSGLFRRDQIWFVEKDMYGVGKLYSLSDFKTAEVRKNEAFENKYLEGKYGAIPFLGDFDLLTKKFLFSNEKSK